jgi:hypothetical protein
MISRRSLGGRGNQWRVSDTTRPLAHAATRRSHVREAGEKPRGGDREFPTREEQEAFRGSYHSKTVDYFERRLRALSGDLHSSSSMRRAGAWEGVIELRDEAAAAVAAWEHSASPDLSELPVWGSRECEQFICENKRYSQRELAERYTVSQPMISKIRRKYGAPGP